LPRGGVTAIRSSKAAAVGRAALYYGGLVALGAALLAALPPIHDFPLRVPVSYEGDGLFFTVLAKIVHEDGVVHATRIGAPFGSDVVDWPIGMWLPFAVMAGLVAVFREPGTAINLYWLSTIVFSSAAAAWALRRLRLEPGIALVLGILYGFQPYAFYRNVAHVNLAFPLVPLLALLCLRTAGTRPGDESRGERWVTITACVAQGLCYVYYSFFACMLLTIAAPIGWLRTGSSRLARRAAVVILLVAAETAIQMVPSVVYWHRHGPNSELAYKAPSDTDVYGLKLRHLLLPIGDHPVPAFRRISAKVWAAAFPGENENASARLGTAGALGFLALLGLVLGRAAGLRPSRDEDLDGAAALTLSTILVAVVGGYGSFFSVFVSPEIRAYNRVVVFLSFFSVFALGTIAARAVARFRVPLRLPPALRPVALGALLVAGVLDQVPVVELGAGRGGSDSQFAEDRAFTRLIEARLPAGAMVFQLPHASIPVDRGSRSRMTLYDPGRAYLHSRSLRWSWGSVIGRTHNWQAAAGALPPRDMLPLLAVAGFSGVWVDRNGYSTGPGLRFDALENELAEVSGETPVVSSRGRYSYLSIELYRRRLERELGPERLERRRLELLSDAPVLRWRKGCSDEKPAGEGWSRTCGRATSLVLNNPAWIDIEITLAGKIRPAAAGRGVLRFSAPGFEDEVELATGMAPYRRVLVLKGAQRLRVNLDYEGACAEGTGDCFEVLDLRASTRPAPRVAPSVVDGARPGR
jgi:hypothetical protein